MKYGKEDDTLFFLVLLSDLLPIPFALDGARSEKQISKQANKQTKKNNQSSEHKDTDSAACWCLSTHSPNQNIHAIASWLVLFHFALRSFFLPANHDITHPNSHSSWHLFTSSLELRVEGKKIEELAQRLIEYFISIHHRSNWERREEANGQYNFTRLTNGTRLKATPFEPLGVYPRQTRFYKW